MRASHNSSPSRDYGNSITPQKMSKANDSEGMKSISTRGDSIIDDIEQTIENRWGLVRPSKEYE